MQKLVNFLAEEFARKQIKQFSAMCVIQLNM